MVNTRAMLFTGAVHRAAPGIGEHHLSRLRLGGLAQAAIELQDVGDFSWISLLASTQQMTRLFGAVCAQKTIHINGLLST